MASTSNGMPSSVLIVGSGVFGLSTAYALAKRDAFKNTKITLLERLDFPAPDAASIDSSRIIRPDYADGAYAALMAEAHPHWRGDFGAEGRYTESGLCIVADVDSPGETADGKHDDEAAHYYLVKALENVKTRLGLKVGKKEDGGQVEPLECAEDVKRKFRGMGGECGRSGYVNWTSGWAHAEDGMKHMQKLVEETGRVKLKTAEVKRLHFDADRVKSVELVSGEQLTAELVLLATGSWTPRLIDLRGIASATGQVLAYIDITQEEQDRLGSNPVLLCESNGMFIIPPRDRVLKVAKHGYGYANPTTIPHPERPESGETITVSLPRTKQDDPNINIPFEGDKACREFLAKTIPDLAERPWTHTRLCWYTDTPSGDWLISYHPTYKNLCVATGGSGHAYKFLPTIGERIVDLVTGEEKDNLGKELKEKWAWPTERRREDHIWTDDWRGGVKGLILDEELAKS